MKVKPLLLLTILLLSFLTFLVPPVYATGPVTVTYTVQASFDDAYEEGDSDFFNGAATVEVASHNNPLDNNYICGGVRFRNFNLPQGIDVTSVSLEVFMQADDDANFDVYAHDTDDSDDFNDNQNIISTGQRPRTTATIALIADNVGGGAWYNITGLQSIVEEVTDRSGWVSGNALTLLLIANTDVAKQFYFQSFDGANTPKLHVTFQFDNTEVYAPFTVESTESIVNGSWTVGTGILLFYTYGTQNVTTGGGYGEPLYIEINDTMDETSWSWDSTNSVVVITGLTAESKIEFYYTNWTQYVFYGLYNETTSYLLLTGVNVTIYFANGTRETINVNGTYAYPSLPKPEYFRFDLAANNDREYWLADSESFADIYIFTDGTNVYDIKFLDLSGALDTYQFVSAKRYVNGTLMAIDKRKVDIEDKVQMALIEGYIYTLILENSASYTYGEFLPTSDTTVELTLTGLEFPQETLLGYTTVYNTISRVHNTPNGTITVYYNDTASETTSVFIEITLQNGVQVYNATEVAQIFTHNWNNALNNTDYRVELTITHTVYGTVEKIMSLPGLVNMAGGAAPWSLAFLGNFPFASSSLIPILLILFAAGLFSVVNAPFGALIAVIMAGIFTYWGWLELSQATLITAFALVILFGISYAKRRSNA